VARPLAGTEGALLPFWSADSRSVAFIADAELKRIDLDGGLVRTLTGAAGAGGTWNQENVILFPPIPASPILRISGEGGAPIDVTRLESSHAGHLYPHFLPGGRHFLYYVQGTPDARGVYVGQLAGGTPRKLFDADSPAVYASGHLLFIRRATLFAYQFDAKRLQLEGQPFAVAEGVVDAFNTSRYTTLSAAPGGSVAFRVGAFEADKQFVWLDRAGNNPETVGAPDPAGPLSPSMSPKRDRVALVRRAEGNADIWLLDLGRGVLSRFTTHPAEDVFPVWSPDGSGIAFLSNRDGKRALYQKSTTRADAEELPIAGGEDCLMNDWSPDGQYLLCERAGTETTLDLWAIPLRGDRKPFPVVRTPARDRNGQFSPDGKWLAYESRESGQSEVYIQPFPGPGEAVQVSTGGGAQVRWRPVDGRELFYVALDGKLMAVQIRVEADGRSLDIRIPQDLFTTRIGRVLISPLGAQYVVSADGQRFLMNTVVQSARPTPIRLILNWNPAAQR
jgi:Tol biopolymer transport system component